MKACFFMPAKIMLLEKIFTLAPQTTELLMLYTIYYEKNHHITHTACRILFRHIPDLFQAYRYAGRPVTTFRHGHLPG